MVIDWAMPEGATVRAARGGTVIGLFQAAPEGGTSAEDLGRDGRDRGERGLFAQAVAHGEHRLAPQRGRVTVRSGLDRERHARGREYRDRPVAHLGAVTAATGVEHRR